VAITLTNPIASDLSVMRLSLWPGLLKTALDNQHRQQEHFKLFERGIRFATKEVDSLAGLFYGSRFVQQWAINKEMNLSADFFDLKGDVEALLAMTGNSEAFRFVAAEHAALHPGRTAALWRDEKQVGWLGELHPRLLKSLGFTRSVSLFEIDVDAALSVRRAQYHEISRFPQVRRDLAMLLDEKVSFSALRERVVLAAPAILQACIPFDVYDGPGVEPGQKSVAIGLIFQHLSRTLLDDEVEAAVTSVVAELRTRFGARVRE
jgi:phenylalanyl-tRNA synthetase beta chain